MIKNQRLFMIIKNDIDIKVKINFYERYVSNTK